MFFVVFLIITIVVVFVCLFFPFCSMCVGVNLTEGPAAQTVLAGQTAMLSCMAQNVTGSPHPLMFQWMANTTVVSPSARIAIETGTPDNNGVVTSFLVIRNTTFTDFGRYRCNAYSFRLEDGVESEGAVLTIQCTLNNE